MNRRHLRLVFMAILVAIPAALLLNSHAAPRPSRPDSGGTPVIDQGANQGFWFHPSQLGVPIFAHEEPGGGTVLIFQTKTGTLSRVVLDGKGAHLTHTLTPFP